MLQYHTVQHASGFVHEQEVVLKPVVIYHTRLTLCLTDFYFFFVLLDHLAITQITNCIPSSDDDNDQFEYFFF